MVPINSSNIQNNNVVARSRCDGFSGQMDGNGRVKRRKEGREMRKEKGENNFLQNKIKFHII